MWLRLVERLVRDQEVASSNLVTPTISSVHNESDEHSFFVFVATNAMLAISLN